MHIVSLHVENFKAIKTVLLEDLPNAVVIAGPNGCGKSSLFDALRLLKSAYGQYQPNEWRQWFDEFQISIQHLGRDAARVLHDPSRRMLVRATISLTDNEKSFLREHGSSIVSTMTWHRLLPRHPMEGESLIITPMDRRLHEDTVQRDTADMERSLNADLDRDALVAELTMSPDGRVVIAPSSAIEVVFSAYRPGQLGVIDYHGANRSYGRERVGNVNLNIDDADNKMRQHALYNTQNKYTNVKTEMASAYVQELLAREAGAPLPEGESLIDTLKELFGVFFPGKTFLGPRPTSGGSLLFPVEVAGGRLHDIDDLSSGEKEVLLGYLRLRSISPRASVILLDEPELHLNPRLIRGLPRFYQKHVGEAFGNQVWMITHSDALLREAIEEPAFGVFHMQSPGEVAPSENQVHRIEASSDTKRAVFDLVGDLATFIPTLKSSSSRVVESPIRMKTSFRICFPTLDSGSTLSRRE